MAMPSFVTDSVTESVFSLKIDRVYFSLSFSPLRRMVMAEFVTESLFSKASDFSYKNESFTKNGSDEVCAAVCF